MKTVRQRIEELTDEDLREVVGGSGDLYYLPRILILRLSRELLELRRISCVSIRPIPVPPEDLQTVVLDLIVEKGGGLKISDIERELRARKVAFERDELRSIVWRLVAAQKVEVTPQSEIVAVGHPTHPRQEG